MVTFSLLFRFGKYVFGDFERVSLQEQEPTVKISSEKNPERFETGTCLLIYVLKCNSIINMLRIYRPEYTEENTSHVISWELKVLSTSNPRK